jgi:hypothetical protein
MSRLGKHHEENHGRSLSNSLAAAAAGSKIYCCRTDGRVKFFKETSYERTTIPGIPRICPKFVEMVIVLGQQKKMD